jgi:hypothetical protein
LNDDRKNEWRVARFSSLSSGCIIRVKLMI